MATKRKAQPRAAVTPREELAALLEELDDEGIDFLLEQARVHRYNMEVEKLNAGLERDAARSKKQKRSGEAGGGSTTGHSSEAMRIERSADGSTYNLVVAGDWKLFTAEEMASLVRIAHSGDPEEEVATRLAAWLERERKDVYLDLGLSRSSRGPAHQLGALLRRTFRPERG